MKKHLFTSLVLSTFATLVYACGGDDVLAPGVDSGPKDTSTADTSTNKDSSVADTSVADTSAADTSVADTSVVDSGPKDAGPTNGCTTFDDHTMQNDPRLITFPGPNLTQVYSVSCMKITKGQSVTWTADQNVTFSAHPLQSENEMGTPIVATSSGTTVTFTFNAPGTYGFHCQFHSFSMKGAITVQ